KHNRLCFYTPGNKRGPKSHRLKTRFANFQPFSNINPYEIVHIQYPEQRTHCIGDSPYPVSGAAYTQYQRTRNIDSISYPILGAACIQYHERLTPSVGNSSHSVSETTKVHNKFINQSTLSSSLFVHDELTSNHEKNIISCSNSSTSYPNNFFSLRTQLSYNNINSHGTTNTFIDQSSLSSYEQMLYYDQMQYDEQNITPSFNSLYPYKYDDYSSQS
ncbi:26867_t:CDS:1, partial [Gigaspora margarita]